MPAATIEQTTPGTLALSGTWTGREIGNITAQLAAVSGSGQTKLLLDGAGIEGLDTAGAWILQKFLIRLRAEGAGVELRGLPAEFANLFDAVGQHLGHLSTVSAPPVVAPDSILAAVGRRAAAACEQSLAMLGFVGEYSISFAGSLAYANNRRACRHDLLFSKPQGPDRSIACSVPSPKPISCRRVAGKTG